MKDLGGLTSLIQTYILHLHVSLLAATMHGNPPLRYRFYENVLCATLNLKLYGQNHYVSNYNYTGLCSNVPMITYYILSGHFVLHSPSNSIQ